MAEINIRRKKKPIWPWLLALLVVVAIIWILTVTTDTDNPEEDPVEENIETPENNTSMDTAPPRETGNAFAWFVKEHEPAAGDSLPVDYIIEGMDHLSATLGSLVDEKFITNPEVNDKRSELTTKIDQLKADSAAERLPGHLQEACISAADLMATLQESSYPELDGTVSGLKKVAASIETAPDENALTRQVERFFEESSHVTLEMTGSADESL